MSTAILPALPLPAARPAPATTVFLPKEHGSWSLVLEPLALGLLVAPSLAGGTLAVAMLAGFFARRPLKAALARERQRVAENVSFSPGAMNETLTRSATARRALVFFMGLAAVAMVGVLALAPWPALWPLLPAAILGVIFAWFDAQNGSRAAAAEVAGSAAFAIVPTVLATLADWSAGAALALGTLALTRSVPTVLAVRSSLRRVKGEAAGFVLPVLAAGVAAAAVSALGAFGLAPAWTALPAWALFARTVWLASPLRPAWPSRRVGMFEALLGLFYVGAIAAAYRA